MRRIKEGRKINKRDLYTIIAIVIIITFYTTSSFGRYVYEFFNDFYLRSKEFYFNSDKLTDYTTQYTITDWPGVNEYDINISMNSKKNSLVMSRSDITYDVTATCDDKIEVTPLEQKARIIPGSDSTNTSANKNTDNFKITLKPKTQLKDGDSVWVKVVATSTTPYEKTISAVFTLIVAKEKVSYKIVDKPNQLYLDVQITNSMSYYLVKTAFGNYGVDDKIDSDTYNSLSDAEKKNCYSADIRLHFDQKTINGNPKMVSMDMSDHTFMNLTDSNIGYDNSVTSNETNDGTKYTYVNEINFSVKPLTSVNIRFYKVDPSKDYSFPNSANTDSSNIELYLNGSTTKFVNT